MSEACIDDSRLYDGSRHTAGTILNELGVDMPTIMEILRHTQIKRAGRRKASGSAWSSQDSGRLPPVDMRSPSGRPSVEGGTNPGMPGAQAIRGMSCI
ncbi:hypothetical protein GCM10010251_91240 [Streptomyces aurantiogriseus]|uniref:Tyr recombinase domain-containing protein n=1 Tax=Streptomyces aurantiogriseus TaxID=66870 RepID=A0A918FNM8_9ACTN|nr:hypothetical protein GCM10010251_91240 [Streptomyces aurantiogriseus]